MEIAKNKQWRSLPTEIEKLVIEFIGCVKLRDGFLVSQLSKADPRRRILTTIPKIIRSVHVNVSGDEIFVSSVIVTRITRNRSTRFEIKSHILNPAIEYAVHPIQQGNVGNIYEIPFATMSGIYRTVCFAFEKDTHPFFNNSVLKRNRIVIESTGTIVNVCI
jgi:hypothetical protein